MNKDAIIKIEGHIANHGRVDGTTRETFRAVISARVQRSRVTSLPSAWVHGEGEGKRRAVAAKRAIENAIDKLERS